MKIIEESCVEGTQGKKMSINSRLKTIQIIGQRKHSTGRIIQSVALQGKKLLTQNRIPIKARKGDRKIMQPIRITSRTAARMRK